MADTMFSDNFATYIDAAAPDFRSIFTTAAEDVHFSSTVDTPCNFDSLEGDYDFDACVRDYVDQLNAALEFLGIVLSVSGQAKMPYGSRPEDEEVRKAIDSIDIYDILFDHDKGQE